MSILDKALTPKGGYTKCTEELTARICELITKGLFPGTAAVNAGMSRRQFQKWLELGRTGEEPYASFLDRVDEARSTVILRVTENLLHAGATDTRAWAANARFLESYAKDEWLRESKITTEEIGEGGSRRPMVIQLVQRDRAPLPEPAIDGVLTEGNSEALEASE